MPYVGFGPMIPASERAKTVLALDRSATVTGNVSLAALKIPSLDISYRVDIQYGMFRSTASFGYRTASKPYQSRLTRLATSSVTSCGM
jgi:hypothetical protein